MSSHCWVTAVYMSHFQLVLWAYVIPTGDMRKERKQRYYKGICLHWWEKCFLKRLFTHEIRTVPVLKNEFYKQTWRPRGHHQQGNQSSSAQGDLAEKGCASSGLSGVKVLPWKCPPHHFTEGRKDTEACLRPWKCMVCQGGDQSHPAACCGIVLPSEPMQTPELRQWL